MQRKQFLRATCALLAVPAVRTVKAQPAFPTKPIRMIVPFPPGGGTDFLARTVANKLAEATGWTIVADNRAGAGGTIGIAETAKAEPNGYTLVMAQVDNLAVAPLLYKNLSYHPVRDVQPVAQVADFPIILLTSSASPYKTLADVVQAARNAPDAVTYASAGNGTVSHLVVELFQATAGVKVRHIPYKGSGPALVDVMGGQVALLSTSIPTVLSQVKAGKLRPLAVSTTRRSAILPDVPTVAEQGFKDFDVGLWYGLFAPAGVPRAVVSQINAEVNKMLQSPELRATVEGQGGEVRPITPEELAARLQLDIAKWRGVITAANIQLE